MVKNSQFVWHDTPLAVPGAARVSVYISHCDTPVLLYHCYPMSRATSSLQCTESLPSLASNSTPPLSRQGSVDSCASSPSVTLTTSQLVRALRVLLLPSSASSSVSDSPVSPPVTGSTYFSSVGSSARSVSTAESSSDPSRSVYSGEVDVTAAHAAVPFVSAQQRTYFAGPDPVSRPVGPLSVCQVLPSHGQIRVYTNLDGRWFVTVYYIGTPLPLAWYPIQL